jgi:SAM-dependent methyltransferase
LTSRMTIDSRNSAEARADAAMFKLAEHFDALASGRTQVPRQPVRTRIAEQAPRRSLLDYHNHMVARAGPLFSHFLASIPEVLEELCRVGQALVDEAERQTALGHAPLCYYEADAFDGTQACTITTMAATAAVKAPGSVLTLTNSPNPANTPHFTRHADASRSYFHQGSFWDIDPAWLHARRDDLPAFADGFDVVQEMVAFQFYDLRRDEQIAHLSHVLKPGGLALFLEKVRPTDDEAYRIREAVKDDLHKAHYFTAEEIAWKREQMLALMERGQVTRDALEAALLDRFSHVQRIWNSGNFYHYAASDDPTVLDRFLSSLGPCWQSPVFQFDAPGPVRR